MSDSTPAQSSPATSPVSGDENLEINRPVEDYAKRLSEVAAEAKKYRQANAELNARLEAIETERLQEQGKHQEIAQKATARATQLEKDLREKQAKLALKTVESQVKAEATKRGCIDSDALMKLMDFSELEVNEDFEVNKDTMSQVLERLTKEKGYLFQKHAAGHRDLPPSNGRSNYKEKGVKEMTLAEKLEALHGAKKK